MTDRKEWKKKSAKKAAKLVEDNMAVGLGSGSTLAKVVEELGNKKSKAKFVAASTSTQKLVEKNNLELVSLEKDMELDLTIDGADEVDPSLDMIKGGGGAHTREKIVANAAEKVAIVVDRTKLVKNLGEKNPIPIEIIPFSKDYTSEMLEKHGEKTILRKSSMGGPFITDNGNYILDLYKEKIPNPKELETELNQIPGVIENGIFTNLPNEIYVGHENGCRKITTRKDFKKFTDNH